MRQINRSSPSILPSNSLSLTQQRLADEAGLPAPQVVSQIEKGEREVKAWELVNIARVLRMDIGELVREEEPAARAPVLWREGPVQDRKVREAAPASA